MSPTSYQAAPPRINGFGLSQAFEAAGVCFFGCRTDSKGTEKLPHAGLGVKCDPPEARIPSAFPRAYLSSRPVGRARRSRLDASMCQGSQGIHFLEVTG